MTDPRTRRELALMQRVILLEVELAEALSAVQRLRDIEQAAAWMMLAAIPLAGIADGARQSWPLPNPDGSDTIGDAK